jgi:hypothetical protein
VALGAVLVVSPSWSGEATSETFDREDLRTFIDRVGTILCVSSVCGLTSAWPCLLKRAERMTANSPPYQYLTEVWNVASAREAYINLPKELVPDNLGFHSTEPTTPRLIHSSSYPASTAASRDSCRRYRCSTYPLSRVTFTRSSCLYTSSRVLRVCLSRSPSSGLRRAVHFERSHRFRESC